MEDPRAMAKARQAYIDLMKHFIEEVQKIDKATPWQETEPYWWVSMQGEERRIRDELKILGGP